MSQCVPPWVYPVWGSLCFLDIGDYFLSHIREVFDYELFKYFFQISPFLFFFFFLDPCNSNVCAFNVVPEVSETVLISFHSFFFILFCSSEGHLPVLMPQLFCY